MNPNNQNGQLNQFKPANPLSLILVGIILIVLMIAAGYIISLLQSSGSEGQTYYKRNKNGSYKTATESGLLNDKKTSTWKTYKSTYSEKFSFKYPAQFNLEVNRRKGFSTNAKGESLLGYEFIFSQGKETPYVAFQMTIENIQEKTLYEYYSNIPNLQTDIIPETPVNNADEQVKVGIGKASGKAFRYGNTIYDFVYPTEDPNGPEKEDITSYIDSVWSTWHFGE